MNQSVVLHIDESPKWATLASNLKNLIADLPNAQIEVVINGEAITLYLQAQVQQFVDQYPKVQFDACQHAMLSHQITADQLPALVKVVPGGVSQLAKLEWAGYAYLKP